MIWLVVAIVLIYFLMTLTAIEFAEETLFYEMSDWEKLVLSILWIPLFIVRGVILLYQNILELFSR